MRPREWVAVHRKHHAATDTADDPHSPTVVGFWRVQLGNVGLYKKVAGDEVDTAQVRARHPADRLDRCVFDHALLGLGVGIAILVTIMWALGLRARHAVVLVGALLHAGLVRDALGRDQRGRSHVRQAAARELGDQRSAARARHRRRRAAQQPSRRADVGARSRCTRRDRPRLVARARTLRPRARSSSPTRPPRRRSTSRPRAVAPATGDLSALRRTVARQARMTSRSWSGPQNSAGAGVVTPFAM